MRELRFPAVAGKYYPGDEAGLRSQIDSCFAHPLGPICNPTARKPDYSPDSTLRALICPHAGYVYSGPVAAHAYQALKERLTPDLVVVIGPNHRVFGPPVSVASHRCWQTPLGNVPVDQAAVAALVDKCSLVKVDDVAHQWEHSVEVQLPFLQHALLKPWQLLPVVMYDQELDTSRALGLALADILRDRQALIVASSDFTHYETHESATKRDRAVLAAIEHLEEQRFAKTVRRVGASLCGPGAIMAAMVAGRALGSTAGRTLCYATSGQIAGDHDYVVGYAAVAID